MRRKHQDPLFTPVNKSCGNSFIFGEKICWSTREMCVEIYVCPRENELDWSGRKYTSFSRITFRQRGGYFRMIILFTRARNGLLYSLRFTSNSYIITLSSLTPYFFIFSTICPKNLPDRFSWFLRLSIKGIVPK